MNKLLEIINQNRKTTIALVVVGIILVILVLFSLFSQLRNSQQEAKPQETTQATTKNIYSIYTTIPSEQEKSYPTNGDITIVFQQNIKLADLKFEYEKLLKFKIIQKTNNVIYLENQNNFKPNKKYQIKVILNKENSIFQENQTNEYTFSFTTGTNTYGEIIEKSVSE
ncbi:Ig-like domain-containing protein [Patescibacteria group bacterium]